MDFNVKNKATLYMALYNTDAELLEVFVDAAPVVAEAWLDGKFAEDMGSGLLEGWREAIDDLYNYGFDEAGIAAAAAYLSSLELR